MFKVDEKGLDKKFDCANKWIYWELKREPEMPYITQFLAKHGESFFYTKEHNTPWFKSENEDWKCDILTLANNEGVLIEKSTNMTIYENDDEAMSEWFVDFV